MVTSQCFRFSVPPTSMTFSRSTSSSMLKHQRPPSAGGSHGRTKVGSADEAKPALVLSSRGHGYKTGNGLRIEMIWRGTRLIEMGCNWKREIVR